MENDKWAAVFGNGYNDLGDGEAKLFIYYLDGSGYEEITTGAGSAGSRNGLSTPAVVDIDGNGKADRVYAGDLEGNLWAFDLSNNSATQWDVAYKQGATKKALFNAAIGATKQPITSKPVIARHPTETLSTSTKPNLLVFFGSGQYLVNGDKEAVDTLLTDPRVQAISFVGSTPIAEYVYQTGGANGKRVQALGGAKNHAIVMPDADMDNAVSALMGAAYGSCGERCMAIAVAVTVGEETGDMLVAKL